MYTTCAGGEKDYMIDTQNYFSFVKNRILELQEELQKVKQKKEFSTKSKNVQRYQLEEDFINRKIAYLRNLVDLPMLLLLSNLTAEQLNNLRIKGLIPANEDGTYLIKKMGLEKLGAFVKKTKIVTVYHVKDAFIDDFKTLSTLISMNERNLELTNLKNRLYGTELNDENTYLRIRNDENQLSLDAAKLDKLVSQANEDFNFETIREISVLFRKPYKKLSKEFILKHSEKIIERNPKMKKVVKKLTRKKLFSWINKLFVSKRNKNEDKFMDALVEYYSDNFVANTLGISTVGLFSKSTKELSRFTSQIQMECKIRSNEINARREDINNSKKRVLKQIKDFDEEQNLLKQNFIFLVQSKVKYFPRYFQDQLWNEPYLKDSCMNEACYLEEKRLIEELINQLKYIQPTSLDITDFVVHEEPKVKKLVA